MARIAELRRFPLKGAASISHSQLAVNTTVGVVGDRRFALRLAPGDLTRREEKFSKLRYVVCANTPAMATEHPFYQGTGVSYRLGNGYLQGLKSRLPNASDIRLQDTHGEYHLGDTAGPQVSFLNLNTVRALEDMAKLDIDPDRFRMNVWLEGLPAFAEYDWVNDYPGTREVMVGDIRMRIDDASERCKATHANPATGEYDLDVTMLLRRFMGSYKSPHRGVASVMGFYGVVLNDGVIKLGDEIRPL